MKAGRIASLGLIIILAISCNRKLAPQQSSTPQKARQVRIDDTSGLFTYGNGTNWPNDSTVYRKVLRLTDSPACAESSSYAMSTVELLQLRNNYTDYSLHTYQSCSAVRYNDTIEITFNFAPLGGGDVIYFAGKPITILMHDSQFTVDITHTSDVSTAIIHPNGEIERIPFPKSDIGYTRLDLNKANYAVGDTIIGHFYARSTLTRERYRWYKQKEQSKSTRQVTHEIAKGSFRLIVGTKEDDCLR